MKVKVTAAKQPMSELGSSERCRSSGAPQLPPAGPAPSQPLVLPLLAVRVAKPEPPLPASCCGSSTPAAATAPASRHKSGWAAAASPLVPAPTQQLLLPPEGSANRSAPIRAAKGSLSSSSWLPPPSLLPLPNPRRSRSAKSPQPRP